MPSPGGGTPTSPGEAPGEPKNQLAGAPPTAKKESVPKADPADRWGDLPIRARELFRNEGSADMPPQYVDWIDAYYRRLSKLQ